MAINEKFHDKRPVVLFNPRASLRIDPKLSYSRASSGTYVDKDGIIRTAAANEPRFEYDFEMSTLKGLLHETAATNEINRSDRVGWGGGWQVRGSTLSVTSNNTEAPDGTTTASRVSSSGPGGSIDELVATSSFPPGSVATRCLSIFAKAGTVSEFEIEAQATNVLLTVDVSNRTASDRGSIHPQYDSIDFIGLANGWVRVLYKGRVSNGFAITMRRAGTMYFWGAQLEDADFHSSYIPTFGVPAGRGPDLLSFNGTLPAAGSAFIDLEPVDASEGDTLLSFKNSSDQKIDLGYLSATETYDSLALVTSYRGNLKTALPLLVPVLRRGRHLITYGTNNYQHGEGSSRFASSLSSFVPSDINHLSIGHDSIDPTRAFSGYINAVYVWPGEASTDVAETLMRRELDPADADVAQTAPTGALSMIINTQGTEVTGDNRFVITARSPNSDNDFTVNWGDGTESTYTGSGDASHTYSTPGVYFVSLEGQLGHLFYNDSPFSRDILELVSWGAGDMYTSPTTMGRAFYGCRQMKLSASTRTTANLPDTSGVTGWAQAFRDCQDITGAFPSFDFSAATTFEEAWRDCSGIAGFPDIGDQSRSVTNFRSTWRGCSSLSSFPLINTSSGTSFFEAWRDCDQLTSFPLIDTSGATTLEAAWYSCNNLAGTFPLISTSNCTTLRNTWRACTSLTGFPLINTSSCANFSFAWRNCNSLTSFPAINTSSGTNFGGAWYGCEQFTSFPVLVFSAATGAPSDGGWTGFRDTWQGCLSLASFPSGRFGTTTCTQYDGAWNGCALTATSIENILVSINAANTNNGELGLDGGTNTPHQNWTTAATNAYNSLTTRGWTIDRNSTS